MRVSEGQSVRLRVAVRRALGALLAFNFALIWALPVFIQGQSFRRGVGTVVRRLYGLVDRSSAVRRFAAKYVYRRQVHVDYFAAATLLVLSMIACLSALVAWQISFGSLPWWLVALYYFIWVGPGGRGMATAWTLAHREGHLSGGKMYRSWLGDRMGNIFENWIGIFYGIVPYTFSTSHIQTHHRFDNGKGDPIYLWDLDRTSFRDLLLYQWRFLLYMTGISSMTEFRRESGVHPAVDGAKAKLRRGMLIYWILVSSSLSVLLLVTGSTAASALLFLFFVYLQPLLAMSVFLSLINIGQHAFLDYDETGQHLKHVTSTTIVDGLDDSFGEDYHVAHHHFPQVDHDRLSEHVDKERLAWVHCRGAIFHRTTFIEIAMMTYLGQFDKLIRNHYVNYGGDGTVEELAALFQRRAQRREMDYEDYEFGYLPNLRDRVRELVAKGVCPDENRAYIYQAHHNLA